MNHRPLRVQSLIQRYLGELLVREFDARGALVTITSVEIDKKLEHAKVYVSVLPESQERATLEDLRDAQGTLQHTLLKKLNIKPLPRIAFELDHGISNAARVEKILLTEPPEL